MQFMRIVWTPVSNTNQNHYNFGVDTIYMYNLVLKPRPIGFKKQGEFTKIACLDFTYLLTTIKDSA